MATKIKYYYALGRRKTSSAKVRLIAGSGQITINQKPASEYLSNSESLLAEINSPLALIGKVDDYDITILVKGGGHHSQVEAIRLGIAKALVEVNTEHKDSLKRNQMLGRDPRAKERKKFGLKGARRKRQFTKR